ncbi:MAG: nitric oxide reductase transcriptional regulator NorR [Planctomycetota bacterium]
MNDFKILLELALDLNESLPAEDRYLRFLKIIHKIIPYDAATLMLLEKETLIPLASIGLSLNAMSRTYPLKTNPRLNEICKSDKPTLFPPESELEDPFDGYLLTDPEGLAHIHACLGCPLIVEGKKIGILTADAIQSNAFDSLDNSLLATLGALAGNALRVSFLIDQLERKAQKEHLVAQDLMKSAAQRGGDQLIGDSFLIQELRKAITLVAKSDFNVLITGETGVGKELVARSIHEQSTRMEKPLIYLNCAALPEPLAESELFGHLKGAFTGADSARVGKFEVADGGTLFLDEIGELSLSIQSKILRTIQEGEIQKVGSSHVTKVDVRLLAATNRELKKEVARGTFRADLYHRLNVFPIHVPPLREHLEDLEVLTHFFSQKIGRKLGIGKVILESEAITYLKNKNYSWPGNVRELKNRLSRTILKAQHLQPNQEIVILSAQDFYPESFVSNPVILEFSEPINNKDSDSLSELVDQFKRKLIQRTLSECNQKWSVAAEKLGMNRSNLHHLAKRLKLKT